MQAELPPVSFVTNIFPGDQPGWLLKHAEDVQAMLRDAENYTKKGIGKLAQSIGDDWMVIPTEADPPLHTEYRKALWPLLLAGEIEFFVAAEGQVPDTPPLRAEMLGGFPVGFIVRAGHPLLGSAGEAGKYPVLISSRSGRSLPPDLQVHAEGPPHIVEDFATLSEITAASDAIWQSSAYAIADHLKSGLLCELPRPNDAFPRELRMMMYSLDRRTQSSVAKSLAHVFRQRIRKLGKVSVVSRQAV